ncbi:hypothetical protein J0X14_05575 [Muricauda sp. CAU 1633]|uniref:hypothetical protein n=1 Tax=Allomuricauda sp. CAU 1633 TaxID=2816036 RepID=UPI001A8F1DD3|nr:hypothetical protein [Muricauda sp. CAU 1633]MBO0321757.1 hypothetical protein [Muricauda sp. CAU 1633]
MKKLIVSSVLVLAAFALWGPMNAFQKRKVTHAYSSIDQHTDSLYSVKYQDCITLQDFPEGALGQDNLVIDNEWDLMKVNTFINRYGQSLDSTIKNLNAIDAHNFLHHEFERSKNILSKNNDLSWIRAHYHREIMRICYDHDKSLNFGSGTNLQSL